MKGLLWTAQGLKKENFSLADVAKPKPGPTEVLVKIIASALNPVDWKIAEYNFLKSTLPITLGCDMAGIVEEVGSEVTSLKKGDEVYGFTKLAAPGTGTFAEYCVVEANFVGKKPANISMEGASTLGVGALTAADGLYFKMGLPLPSSPGHYSTPEYLLVWGGSSSVGAFAVQLGRLSGLTVIATASPKNFEYVKSLGATHVIDHSQANAVESIRAITGGKLKYAYDCIGSATADLCVQALSTTEQAQISHIAGGPKTIPANVKSHNVFVGGAFANPEEAKFLIKAYNEFFPLLESAKLKPNEVQLLPGGLAGVYDGLELLHHGKVSAKKLVAVISQTP